MEKKFKSIIIYVIIVAVAVITTILVLTTKDNYANAEVSKDKINSELEYIDTKLLELFNNIAGITIENYIVTAEEINNDSDGRDKDTTSESDDESSSNSTGNSKSSSGGSQDSNSQTSTEDSKTKNVKYTMNENSILGQDRAPDWKATKSEVEKLYNTWTIVELDLYKENVNNQNILNFNTELDAVTQHIKNEDMVKSLSGVAKLYSYIPEYINDISTDSSKTNVYKTKSFILNACAFVEQEDFISAKNELLSAEESFLPIVNNIDSQSENQSSINKTYILIKELQNSIDLEDKDIFYIKYKNLIQEINYIK